MAESKGTCSRCSNCSDNVSSSNSVFSDVRGASPILSPIRLNDYRFLIVDGVLENPFENLAA